MSGITEAALLVAGFAAGYPSQLEVHLRGPRHQAKLHRLRVDHEREASKASLEEPRATKSKAKKNSQNWSYTGGRTEPPSGLVCGPCRDFIGPFSSKAELEDHQLTVHGVKHVLTNGESR